MSCVVWSEKGSWQLQFVQSWASKTTERLWMQLYSLSLQLNKSWSCENLPASVWCHSKRSQTAITTGTANHTKRHRDVRGASGWSKLRETSLRGHFPPGHIAWHVSVYCRITLFLDGKNCRGFTPFEKVHMTCLLCRPLHNYICKPQQGVLQNILLLWSYFFFLKLSMCF